MFKKKVLIIGATSNLGKSLTKLLNKFKIYTAGRKNSDFFFDATNEVIDENILKRKFDIIINLVAGFKDDNYTEICNTEKISTIGIIKICEIAKRCNAEHLIHISSISRDYNPSDRYYGIYSIAKKHGDELLKYFCNRENINYTILMPSQLYDYEGNCKIHQGFLYSLIQKIIDGRDVVIYGKNDPKRNYIHVDDVAEIIKKVIIKKLFGEYYCCALKDTSYTEIFNISKNIIKSKSDLRFDKSKPDISDLPKVYDFNIYDEIDFYPQKILENGLLEIIKEMTNA